MFCTFWLKKDWVLIPTFAKVRGGPHWVIEPVVAVPVSDTAALRRALSDAIERGNPVIPKIPPKADQSEPAALKITGDRSLLSFQRRALGWWLNKRDGIYKIEGLMEEEGYHGGKVTDPNQVETFPPGTSADTVIDRMIAILQTAATKQH